MARAHASVSWWPNRGRPTMTYPPASRSRSADERPRMSQSRWLAFSLVMSLAACGPSGSGDDDDDDDDGGACTAGQTQCVGTQFQTCVDGAFTTMENCAGTCDPTDGCRACTPGV